MELKDVIRLRHSSRSFKKQKIKKEDIIDIIDCARLAPSAANRQNWLFIILEDKEKDKIALMMEEYLQKIEEKIKSKEKPTKEYSPVQSVIESIQVIKEASNLILVFRHDDINWLEGDYLSIGCAVEHMVLRATDLGLNSLWLRDVIYLKSKITNLFNLNDMELVTGLALGYENENKFRATKKDLKEIMKFGNE